MLIKIYIYIYIYIIIYVLFSSSTSKMYFYVCIYIYLFYLFQLNLMYNGFIIYERVFLTTFPCPVLSPSSLIPGGDYLSQGGGLAPSSPFPFGLNEFPWVGQVWPDSCARGSLSKSSSKQRIRQRLGGLGGGGAALGGVRSGNPFYCRACSPGCCPPRG